MNPIVREHALADKPPVAPGVILSQGQEENSKKVAEGALVIVREIGGRRTLASEEDGAAAVRRCIRL